MGIFVGCVPITWGKWKREAPDEWPEERILAEVARAGYVGASAGPRGEQTPQEIAALYARHGLKPAPGYLAGSYWQPQARDDILEKAKRQAAFARGLGLEVLYVAPQGGDYVSRGGKTRRQLAGHVGPADGLTDDEYERMGEVLNEVGAATLVEGVQSCFHNHVGQVIETREECDRLLALTDPNLLFLGPDTGHLAWGGADVVAFVRDYAPRIKTMHLKDIHEPIRAQGQAEAWDYQTSTARGIFAELGEGSVDFPEVLRLLGDAGFEGWLLAETDVTQKPTALESATVSRDYLRSIGV